MDSARYLENGRLTVFRRNGTYYARLRVSPGKYVTRSLKTTVEEKAVQLGRRLLFQLEHRAEQGLPPKSKLFAAVIDDYIRFRERDYAHGKTSAGMLRQIKRVSKFWREYAGKLAVEEIECWNHNSFEAYSSPGSAFDFEMGGRFDFVRTKIAVQTLFAVLRSHVLMYIVSSLLLKSRPESSL